MRRWLVVLALAGCRGHARPAHDDARPRAARDAATAAARDAAAAWPELAGLPRAAPLHVVALPVRASTPRFDVGGPAIAGDVAIVASSQFGFLAVDLRRGQLAWDKPAGLHVAPPLARAHDAVLIGDCVTPPDVPEGERLLGCLRVVTPAGADLGHVAIHGRGEALAAFAAAAGPQQVWASGDRTVTWRRGDAAVAIDTRTGAAAPAPAAAAPPVVGWQVTRDDDGTIVARDHGKPAWRSARPLPGIGLVGDATDPAGDAALAVQLDTSLARDYVAGYAAGARLAWVYPLPAVPRTDPVGLAIAPGAVVAFHDGDTLTILPAVSAAPTPPGAPAGPSENATP